MKALELFCGIGGFAAAAGTNIRIAGALDQSAVALAVYRWNFPEHPARQADLEKITADELAGYGADLWWLSPPCQPYTVRGRKRDLDDPRARSLGHLLAVFPEIPPDRLPIHLALENVPGFALSQARDRLTSLLLKRGYQIRERHLCPTELGIPSRRPRYYLSASRLPLRPSFSFEERPLRPLLDFLDLSLNDDPPPELLLAPEVLTRFGDGFRILDPDEDTAYTTCFTGGYGKSLMHAGSYLRCRDGVRHFAPHEIARLLGFPVSFRFPEKLSLRKRWKLLGNSLSVCAVREVLNGFSVHACPTAPSLFP
ncbi:MAG: DNA methyltransferase [Desulfuromonadaceae bacterium]|nr:DNA methyltransferase [Desulfuromonadaceae bacterium]